MLGVFVVCDLDYGLYSNFMTKVVLATWFCSQSLSFIVFEVINKYNMGCIFILHYHIRKINFIHVPLMINYVFH